MIYIIYICIFLNGRLTYKFLDRRRTPGMAKKLNLLGVSPEEAESLFELMDIDKPLALKAFKWRFAS